MEWSDELEQKLNLLTGAQRRGIERMVAAQWQGVPLARLLRTPYSCKWCGQRIGRDLKPGEDRKQVLFEHQDNDCEQRPRVAEDASDDEAPARLVGAAWHFIASERTFYMRWMKSRFFKEALEQARREAAGLVLAEAGHKLQMATGLAVEELIRQVLEAARDVDRYRSAVAILDRADVTLAPIQRSVADDWLKELRDLGDDGDDDSGEDEDE